MVQTTNNSRCGRQLGCQEDYVHPVLGGTKRKYASLGDVIIVTIKEAIPNAKVKKGEIAGRSSWRTRRRCRVPMVPTSASTRTRRPGRQGQRAGGNPHLWPVARELRAKRFMKIISLARRCCDARSQRRHRGRDYRQGQSKRGHVLRILSAKERVVVERIAMVKRHTKPTQRNPRGGILEKEGTLEASNVALWCGSVALAGVAGPTSKRDRRSGACV